MATIDSCKSKCVALKFSSSAFRNSVALDCCAWEFLIAASCCAISVAIFSASLSSREISEVMLSKVSVVCWMAFFLASRVAEQNWSNLVNCIFSSCISSSLVACIFSRAPMTFCMGAAKPSTGMTMRATAQSTRVFIAGGIWRPPVAFLAEPEILRAQFVTSSVRETWDGQRWTSCFKGKTRKPSKHIETLNPKAFAISILTVFDSKCLLLGPCITCHASNSCGFEGLNEADAFTLFLQPNLKLHVPTRR